MDIIGNSIGFDKIDPNIFRNTTEDASLNGYTDTNTIKLKLDYIINNFESEDEAIIRKIKEFLIELSDEFGEKELLNLLNSNMPTDLGRTLAIISFCAQLLNEHKEYIIDCTKQMNGGAERICNEQ